MYKAVATLAFVLIVVAWTRRRQRRVHVPVVLAGIALDLGIVGMLEFNRSVVDKAIETDWTALQTVHILASTVAVLLYFPTLWFGFRLLRGAGGAATRGRHRLFALGALGFRTVGFLCMWAV